jgi:hypothetical protein
MSPLNRDMRVALVVLLHVVCANVSMGQDSAAKGSTYGSSIYLSGGYGMPSNVLVDGGYVFGSIASVGLLFTGPYSSEAMLAFNVGFSGRLFVPMQLQRFAPFFAVSLTDSSPFTTIAGEDRREEITVGAGTLFTLQPGTHLRGMIGGARVNNNDWQLGWYLQFEFTLGEIRTR